MHIQDLAGKNICILGFGREGKAMAEALEKYAKGCTITIADQSTSLPATRYPLVTGPDAFKNLKNFDVIIKSPGIPPHQLQATSYKLLVSPTQIFLDSIADSGAIVIGVTGSKGKSTTSSLIHHLLPGSLLIGNIGEPAISHIAEAKANTVFVMEMSSYQLMDLDRSPTIAVITSFFPEHLDYHKTVEKYLEAKKHITRFQKKGDIVFFNATNELCKEIAKEGEGKKVPVSVADYPVHLKDTKLIGEHNKENIALAWKVAEFLGVNRTNAIDAIKTFNPLPHRLQSLGVHHGFEWVNDSISTTPESAIAALDALGDRVAVLILGGQDRGLDFSGLAKRIKESKVQAVITIGESGPRIASELKKAGCMQWIIEAETLENAVKEAKLQKPSIKNPIVLLSPASPSYDRFKNFEERGNQFEKLIV